jgi:Trk K+ transport system NAD-binding subunit
VRAGGRAWHWCRRTWASYRGITPLALLFVALILGYVGYRAYFTAAGESRPWYDLLYYDLQLLTFNTRSASDPTTTLPWTLQVARFMAPLVAGYGALVGMMRLFRDRFDQSRARFSRHHTIVAGAGATGLAFVRSLRAEGRRIVVLDDGASNPNLEACRDLGALVLEADARQPESLLRAGIGTADHLVAVCGDDGTNAETVLNAQRVVRRPDRPLRCLAHIDDPDLWQLLRASELVALDRAPVRLDCFNIYEHGARAMLTDHPPRPASPDRAAEVLVVGDGPLAARLVIQLVRRGGGAPGTDRLRLTLLAPAAGALRAKLVAETPQLTDHADVRALHSALGHAGRHLEADLEATDIAYVCTDADSTAVLVAQALRTSLPLARIVVSLSRSDGIVGLFERRYVAGPPGLHQIAPFPLLDRTCHPEALLAGAQEGVAEAIHARFQEEQLAAGTLPSDPRVAAWDDLSPDRQESCRSQAASVSDKLRLIGCDLVPRRGWDVSSFSFTESECDRLARQEHDRWRDERTTQGWRHGPVRDEGRKQSPLLVDWEDLDEDARETTRRMIIHLPELVEGAGYQIVRLRAAPVDQGWVEPVARAIHDRYLARRAEDGQDEPDSAIHWEELDDKLRDSNRAQAADITTKLASIGCHVVPAAQARGFDGLSATEVEELSRQEHDRWVDERRAAGWQRGPRGHRRSPDIVAWDDLGNDRRELDREAVRAIPDVLAAAGLGIAREPAGSP